MKAQENKTTRVSGEDCSGQRGRHTRGSATEVSTASVPEPRMMETLVRVPTMQELVDLDKYLHFILKEMGNNWRKISRRLTWPVLFLTNYFRNKEGKEIRR